MTKQDTPVQRLALNDRDLRMLRSLADAGSLTVRALEWVHVPSWRTRWQAWKTRCDAGAHGTPSYTPSSRFYQRLRQLEAAGLVRRVQRPITIVRAACRAADLYTLAALGAEVLIAYGGMNPDDVQAVPAAPTLPDSGELGQVYAALRAATATTPGVRMEEWLRAPCRHAGACAAAPVQPDATFRLITPTGACWCCVELDHGCPATTWRAKVRAYTAHGQHDPTQWVVLTMTTTGEQRTRLMEATAQELTQGSDTYLFSLLDDAHPTRIDQWLTIREIATHPAHPFGGPGAASAGHVHIRTAPYTLF